MKIKKIYIILGVIAVLLIAVVGSCVSQRNGMVSANQAVKNAWGDVENQYQRRLDLIPNLVNIVKGYAEHESTTLQSVTDARAGLKKAYDAARDASADTTINSPQFAQSQADLQRQLGIYINAVHEAYPDLKANQNFQDLQVQLEGTENRISTARDRFNKAVEEYNNKILRFPGSLFAWGYSEKDMFKADPSASKAPTVDFSGNQSPSVDF